MPGSVGGSNPIEGDGGHVGGAPAAGDPHQCIEGPWLL
jgi:hypothetical protein